MSESFRTEIEEALEKAHSVSTRPGKWSTPRDVQHFTDTKVNTGNLRGLVKDGAASEKVSGNAPLGLFRPRSGGAATSGSASSSTEGRGHRGIGRPTGRYHGGKKPGGGRRSQPKTGGKPSGPRSGNLRGTLGTGISFAILGGMGGASSGGGTATTATGSTTRGLMI